MMKKKILLAFVLMAAFATAMSAQDMEQTATPILHEGQNIYQWEYQVEDDYIEFLADVCNYVTIENADEADATIYYRYRFESEYETSEWMEYAGDVIFSGGAREATVEAYAVAEGKLPSEIVSANLYYFNGGYIGAAFIVDGIHYFKDYAYWPNPYTEVFVCSPTESHLYSQPYSGDLVIPGEVVYGDESYSVVGIREGAFASSFDDPCNITSVELPNTIIRISHSAFAGCIRLNKMILHSLIPPDGYDLFYYEYDDQNYYYYDYVGFEADKLYDQVTLFVPNESLEAYHSAMEWGRFTHIVPFIGIGPGDMNGDGSINISDVTNIINLISTGAADELPAYCDMNGDGEVNISDVIMLIMTILGGN
jgi:hypothetical protein